jgi:hypothetical protein
MKLPLSRRNRELGNKLYTEKKKEQIYSRCKQTHTQAQYLSTQPRETRTLTQAVKARQKRRVAGPTTGCRPNESVCIEEKQRVRQPAVRYTQKNKQKINKHIHEHTQGYIWCMLV